MEIAARLHTSYQHLETKDLNVGIVLFIQEAKVTGRKNSEGDGWYLPAAAVFFNLFFSII